MEVVVEVDKPNLL